MKQVIKIILGLFPILLLSTIVSFGAETFGPQKFTRSDGAPDVYTRSFGTIAGPGKIVVRNGDYNGEKRVPYAISSAKVFLNGTQIFGPDDFGQTAYYLEANINLTEDNSIRVELASQPGDFLTVSIEQEIPPPIIHAVTATPESIVPGQTSTLTWETENVTACTMEPDIGPLTPNGSIIISPENTTTYTLTATGPGGTTHTDVTVTVILSNPEADISAEPVTINLGESATLSWTSRYADTCTIDQGIGSVPKTGTMAVTPVETTTYTITAVSASGHTTASAGVTVVPIGISITSPANNDTITHPDVEVMGTLGNFGGSEVGVTVNGIPALIDGNAFVANHVPLVAGENRLTVVAAVSAGIHSSVSVLVNMSPVEDYIRMTADTESGVAPFKTTLKAGGTFTYTAQPPTYTGPGTVEIINGVEENEFLVSIATPGIYYFTLQTQFEDHVYSDTISLCVMDQTELDSLIKAKWNGMKHSLISGNIEKALAYHQKGVYEKYSAIYSAIGDELPAFAQQMGEISPVYFKDVLAKYRIRQDHDINGKNVTITYYVYFSKDENGLWLIENY